MWRCLNMYLLFIMKWTIECVLIFSLYVLHGILSTYYSLFSQFKQGYLSYLEMSKFSKSYIYFNFTPKTYYWHAHLHLFGRIFTSSTCTVVYVVKPLDTERYSFRRSLTGTGRMLLLINSLLSNPDNDIHYIQYQE